MYKLQVLPNTVFFVLDPLYSHPSLCRQVKKTSLASSCKARLSHGWICTELTSQTNGFGGHTTTTKAISLRTRPFTQGGGSGHAPTFELSPGWNADLTIQSLIAMM